MPTPISAPNHPGDLRVWWIPQVPGKPFHVPVKDVSEAKLVLTTLARYDQFQLQHNIKPDYCNAGGLEVYRLLQADEQPEEPNQVGVWEDWCDDEGRDIDDIP